MKRLKKWLLRPGRAARLQLFLAFLIGSTMAFVLITLIELNVTYHKTGSFEAMWHEEWRSGRAITSIVWSGPFQLFLLATRFIVFPRQNFGYRFANFAPRLVDVLFGQFGKIVLGETAERVAALVIEPVAFIFCVQHPLTFGIQLFLCPRVGVHQLLVNDWA